MPRTKQVPRVCDSSPKRSRRSNLKKEKEEEQAKSHFVPSVADQVVSWLGEPYRAPWVRKILYVSDLDGQKFEHLELAEQSQPKADFEKEFYNAHQIDWNAMTADSLVPFIERLADEGLIEDEEEDALGDGTLPYALLVAFFLWTPPGVRDPNRGAYLQILLERVCNQEVTSFLTRFDFYPRIWPKVLALKLGHLDLWNHLERSMLQGQSFVSWCPDGKALKVRWEDPIREPMWSNQYNRELSAKAEEDPRDYPLFAPTGIEKDIPAFVDLVADLRLNRKETTGQELAQARLQARACLQQMNSYLLPNFGHLLTLGKVQFPAVDGENPAYDQLKALMRQRPDYDGLEWDNLRLSVSLPQQARFYAPREAPDSPSYAPTSPSYCPREWKANGDE